mmetsp:Transcript_7400/g.11262  ORF Transcript_7400/g.11262 Transcript_7400/m.11262 type:complete len:381 (-) Transcript_7400:69-1211(-)|eukprot:CAMPEP_0203676538 /NCGR_PEP_ID=MMETSP0090-20130426/24868_1 /ASSEMBLY_ACC=CAM_ASM_001088 /TAXON_ID=426623 /ORGANISM="Chaetoceros affinis, Strain CCMP159" /LENGTH=380 /DNA_ID=CAMNT_0050543113 /DNA_START=92 /DNA_END=1234 /DNA_ORIENTATION=-
MMYPRLKVIALALSSAIMLSRPQHHALAFSLFSSMSTSTTSASNLTLGKKSTALDVLNSLNKNSRLASYVKRDLNQRRKPIAIVTGGSSGIGVPSVETLSLAGMKVVLCARNVTAAESVVLKEIPPSLRSNIRVQELDLSDMASIESAVKEIIEKDCDGGLSDIDGEIDVLLNNAGVMAPPKRLSTVQGLELQFGTNHVGHHMLTRLLLPYIRKDGRIVTVASTAHTFGQLDFANLNYDQEKSERGYSAWNAYGQSKLANVLFAKGLDEKLKEAGSEIKSVSLHPGVIGTNLWRYTPKWTRPLLNAVVTDRNIKQGAASNVFCCLVESSEFQGGEYVVDCAIAEPSSQGKDELKTLRKKLWDATENLIADNGFSLPDDVY